MLKSAKKYGNTLVFQFSAEEQRIYGIKENKVYDVEISKARKTLTPLKKKKENQKFDVLS